MADRYEPYDIVITDKRPSHDDFTLVKVGGKPADLDRGGKNIGGIAPYTGEPLPKSVVFVFDQGGKFRTKNNCETAAHEIGHVLGLDHTRECKDIMSYEHGCGRKEFVDKHMRCGEEEGRECNDGHRTQNSAEELMRVLGPRIRS